MILFHGNCGQYRYLPLAITCAETDAVVLAGLRHGTCAAFLGAGFGVPVMYDVCKESGVTYTFGFAMNARLQRETQELLDQAASQYEATHEKQRLFARLDYQAGGRPQPRTVIVKCEAHAQGTNRRAVVTNRPGARNLPEGTYDEYAARGESENCNKELKDSLCAERLSDHRFLANFCRLILHAAALNLLTRLRRAVAKAPTPAELGIPDPLTTGALPEKAKQRFFNRRRRHDPLGEGQPCTFRSRLIKVAAEIIVSSRRVLVKLSSSWPHLDELFRVGGLAALPTGVEPPRPGDAARTRQTASTSLG